MSNIGAGDVTEGVAASEGGITLICGINLAFFFWLAFEGITSIRSSSIAVCMQVIISAFCTGLSPNELDESIFESTGGIAGSLQVNSEGLHNNNNHPLLTNLVRTR
jgi:hypothetical protein